MNTREDYEKALAVIGDVIRSWDPYSLIEGGAPRNEFDSEVAQLVTYVPKLRSSKDAAEAVSTVFSNAFDPEKFSVVQCAPVGQRLFQRLSKEGLVQGAE
jgi:uncharacterized protein DUF1871